MGCCSSIESAPAGSIKYEAEAVGGGEEKKVKNKKKRASFFVEPEAHNADLDLLKALYDNSNPSDGGLKFKAGDIIVKAGVKDRFHLLGYLEGGDSSKCVTVCVNVCCCLMACHFFYSLSLAYSHSSLASFIGSLLHIYSHSSLA